MNLFNTDWEKLARMIVPVSLRGPKLLAFLNALLAPVIFLHGRLLAYRLETFYTLEHNSQVCRLRAALNDEFDMTDRTIIIADGPDKDPTWIYRRAEEKPKYIFRRAEALPERLYQKSETTRGADFIIQVPSAIVFDAIKMRAVTDRFKLPSKDYSIELI